MDSQENKHEEGFDFMGGGSSADQPMNMNQQESSFVPMNAFEDSSLPSGAAGGMGDQMAQFSS